MDTKKVILGIARHVLTAVGGALITAGVITESMSLDGVGAILALAGVIWSAIDKNKA
jgi:hypothetical protein